MVLAPGSKPRPSNGGMGFVDMVITPTVGTGFLLFEDVVDRYVIAKLESHTHNTFLTMSARIVLNPARSSANLMRVEKPWHRESRGKSMIEAGLESDAGDSSETDFGFDIPKRPNQRMP